MVSERFVFSRDLFSLKQETQIHVSILSRRGEGGGRAWGRDLIVIVVPRVGLLTDLTFPGRGYLNLSSLDVRIFERRPVRKRLRPTLFFPRHACALLKYYSKDLKPISFPEAAIVLVSAGIATSGLGF